MTFQHVRNRTHRFTWRFGIKNKHHLHVYKLLTGQQVKLTQWLESSTKNKCTFLSHKELLQSTIVCCKVFSPKYKHGGNDSVMLLWSICKQFLSIDCFSRDEVNNLVWSSYLYILLVVKGGHLKIYSGHLVLMSILSSWFW